jgi:antitoxin component HigA of HigAB toxin-antitoxin module
MLSRIHNEKEYKLVTLSIEGLLEKATRSGGFHKLGHSDITMLEKLSQLAEQYEDHVLRIMPIRPRTLGEAIELRRAERKLTQAELARLLGVGAPKLSQILSGKRRADVAFLKAVHRKLKLDAEFILKNV